MGLTWSLDPRFLEAAEPVISQVSLVTSFLLFFLGNVLNQEVHSTDIWMHGTAHVDSLPFISMNLTSQKD